MAAAQRPQSRPLALQAPPPLAAAARPPLFPGLPTPLRRPAPLPQAMAGDGTPSGTRERMQRALAGLLYLPHLQAQRDELSLPVAAAPAAGAAKGRPWDRGDLFRRLATFKSGTWFCKPAAIGPVECARRGWTNTGPDMLTCEVGPGVAVCRAQAFCWCNSKSGFAPALCICSGKHGPLHMRHDPRLAPRLPHHLSPSSPPRSFAAPS